MAGRLHLIMFGLMRATSHAFTASSLHLHAMCRPGGSRQCFPPTHASQIRHFIVPSFLTNTEFAESFYMAAFAGTHIGASAVRESLIAGMGALADEIGLVGNDWRLPDIWPGDDAAGNAIWPDRSTAGRQLYRLCYTVVAFGTLGSALRLYLEARTSHDGTILVSTWALLAAVAANAASLTSLLNASPLGLVPSFEANDGGSVRRNDVAKCQARGLTRITRHPLILPLVPWGIANAVLVGNDAADWIFFGGLAIYAVAGCAAQDLRVKRQEGSVGTVVEATSTNLMDFYGATSFWPFAAILDGRQSLTLALKEISWAVVLSLALPVGLGIESAMLHWLSVH